MSFNALVTHIVVIITCVIPFDRQNMQSIHHLSFILQVKKVIHIIDAQYGRKKRDT